MDDPFSRKIPDFSKFFFPSISSRMERTIVNDDCFARNLTFCRRQRGKGISTTLSNGKIRNGRIRLGEKRSDRPSDDCFSKNNERNFLGRICAKFNFPLAGLARDEFENCRAELRDRVSSRLDLTYP